MGDEDEDLKATDKLVAQYMKDKTGEEPGHIPPGYRKIIEEKLDRRSLSKKHKGRE